MRIAILALQGAFAEHQQMLEHLGVESFLIRNLKDWQQPMDGLIIPGGESTTMLLLLKDLALFDPIREAIMGGLPVFGTCAGLIMLDAAHLDTMDIKVKRNAYGRQNGSFHTEGEIKGIGQVPMTYIRAPYITETGPKAEVLAEIDGHIVAARQQNQFVTSFHPELDSDLRVHQYFIDMCSKSA